MGRFRTFLKHHHMLAFLLVMTALFLKAAIPNGFMVESGSKTISVLMCHDASGATGAREIVVPLKNTSNGDLNKAAKGECPYASFSMASLSGADPALLLQELAFIIALGFLPLQLTLSKRAAFLRPPLRGPPAANL